MFCVLLSKNTESLACTLSCVSLLTISIIAILPRHATYGARARARWYVLWYRVDPAAPRRVAKKSVNVRIWPSLMCVCVCVLAFGWVFVGGCVCCACMHTCVCQICLRSFVPVCMHTCTCVYVQRACMDMYVSDRHNRHVCLLCMVYFKEGEGVFFGEGGLYA